MSFSTPLQQYATTGTATEVTGATAVLNGTIDTEDLRTIYGFEYGLTTSYGEDHDEVAAVAQKDSGIIQASFMIDGLKPNTTYHFRAVAWHPEGPNPGTPVESYGQDATFTTTRAPAVTTDRASGVTTTGATLNGSVSPSGVNTSYQFEYDTAPYKEGEGAHGTSVPVPAKGAGSGTEAVPVSEAITGLKAATTYHYRVVASNAEGTAYGADEAFTTWGTWSLQPPAAPKVAEKASLADVSCPSGTYCLAVGYDEYARRSVAQKWDGEKWSLYEGSLDRKPKAVSCTTSAVKTCFSIGEKTTGGFFSQKWTFGSTSEVELATPEGGTLASLDGVSCAAVTSSACTLVGSYSKEGKTKPLIERFGGGVWSLQSAATGEGALRDVSCPSESECIAVGREGSILSPKPLIERWNGTSWSALSSPLPSGSTNGSLSKVSCSSTSSCVATGGAGSTPYAVRWDGKEWTLASSGLAAPSDLSCTAASSCIAVGEKEGKTLMQAWNGTSWSAQSSPNPEGKTPSLVGVSCTSATACIAVGKATFGEGESATFGERLNTTWSLQPPAAPKVAEKASLADVSCPSGTYCLAVGYDEYARRSVAQKWDGEKWSLYEGSLDRKPKAVSCTTSAVKTCFSIGEKTTGGFFSQKWTFRVNLRSRTRHPRRRHARLPRRGLLRGGHLIGLHAGRLLQQRRQNQAPDRALRRGRVVAAERRHRRRRPARRQLPERKRMHRGRQGRLHSLPQTAYRTLERDQLVGALLAAAFRFHQRLAVEGLLLLDQFLRRHRRRRQHPLRGALGRQRMDPRKQRPGCSKRSLLHRSELVHRGRRKRRQNPDAGLERDQLVGAVLAQPRRQDAVLGRRLLHLRHRLHRGRQGDLRRRGIGYVRGALRLRRSDLDDPIYSR